ncbi:putative toxin-antitoxin system toxin component, PIN family [Rhodopila sp.]|uniref:putative toxin-antitoxin system toxin component, PIN family n=1 Tax=Rhodopila sp. TaxID=2480087 RepID=UPI003D10DA9C
MVFDASTLVGAAMVRSGTPGKAFDRALAVDTLALSRAVRDEILDVFNRPKLARFLDETLRDEFLALLLASARLFEPTDAVADCRDASDNKYLELMLAAQADKLVSSDKDLLVLTRWRGRRILRPADYLLANP